MQKFVLKQAIILCVVLAFLTVSASSFGQVFRNYTVEHGLKSNVIHELFQDSHGFIWIGGDFGVTRFDGNAFKHFSAEDDVVDNLIIHIAEDRHGNVWFGSLYNEFCYYSYTTGKFTKFALNDELKTKIHRPIHQIAFSESDLLFSGKGLYTYVVKDYYGDDPTMVPSDFGDTSYLDITLHSENVIHCAFNGRTPKHIRMMGQVESLIPAPVFADRILNVYKLKHPYQVLAIEPNELVLLDYKTRTTTKHRIDYLALGEFMDEEDGHFWVASYNDGVFRYPNRDLSSPPKQLLHGNTVTDILKDAKGGIWISTLSNGLFYTPNTIVAPVLDQDGRQVEAELIASDLKSKIAYTEDYNSVSVAKRSSDDSWTMLNYPTPSLVYYIHQHLNRTLVFRRKSAFLYELNESGFSTYLGDTIVRHFVKASMLYTLHQGHHGYQVRIQDGAANSRTFLLANSQRIRKIIPINNRSFYFENRLNQFHYAQTNDETGRVDYHLIPQLDRFEIIGLYDVNNVNTLITRKSGALVMRDSIVMDTLQIFKRSDTIINNVFHDTSGTQALYILTNQGIFTTALNGQNARLIVNNSTGLPVGEIMDMTRVGNLFIVLTSKGTYQFDTASFDLSVAPSIVQIGRVLLNGEEVELENEFELQTGKHAIQVDMFSIQFANAFEILYRYRLDQSADWINTRERSIYIPSLESGKYTLEIQAKNAVGKWGESETLHFNVLPPFWKRTWVHLVAFVLFALIVLALYQVRIARAKRKMDLRYAYLESQSQALATQLSPHFVFNTMNSLSSFISKNEKIQSIRYLAKLAKLMRAIYENSQLAQIPLSDDIETLRAYLELEQLRFDFEYEIDIDERIVDTPIPSMIIQPFVENGIKHGFEPGNNNKILIKAVDLGETVAIEIHNTGPETSLSIEQIIQENPNNSIALIFRRLEMIKRLFNYQVGVDVGHSDVSVYNTRFKIVLPKNKGND